MKILGIETSCDDSCIAIIDDKKIICNLKYTHTITQYGGIIPELSARTHLEKLPILLQKALQDTNLSLNDINAIGVTYTPGLIGSLVVGYNFAIGLARKRTFVPINHLEAHFLVAEQSFPYLALLISGGHSSIYKCNKFNDYELLVTTKDDAVGEIFDKIGRHYKLEYPYGMYLERYFNEEISKNSTLPHTTKGEKSFSFSGLKTAVLKSDLPLSTISSYLHKTVADILEEKVNICIKETGISKLVVAGGVAANKYIRCRLEKLGAIFPPIPLCTDNAAMIAIAAGMHIENNSPFVNYYPDEFSVLKSSTKSFSNI
jgi:N6-L-threonylcarbamoyladenine synthase